MRCRSISTTPVNDRISGWVAFHCGFWFAGRRPRQRRRTTDAVNIHRCAREVTLRRRSNNTRQRRRRKTFAGRAAVDYSSVELRTVLARPSSSNSDRAAKQMMEALQSVRLQQSRWSRRVARPRCDQISSGLRGRQSYRQSAGTDGGDLRRGGRRHLLHRQRAAIMIYPITFGSSEHVTQTINHTNFCRSVCAGVIASAITRPLPGPRHRISLPLK